MLAERKFGTLAGTLRELRDGTFLANAGVRSSRRKSPWNLLLLLAFPLWLLLFGGGITLARFAALAILQGRTLPATLIWPGAIAPFIVYIPMLIATVLAAMVAVNYAVCTFVPPARRAVDSEDQEFRGVEYAAQQPLLVPLATCMLAIAFALAVLGEMFL